MINIKNGTIHKLTVKFRNSILTLPDRLYSHRVLWGWLWAMGICGILDIIILDPARHHPIAGGCYLIFVGALKATVILTLLQPLLCSRVRPAKWLAWLVVALFSFFSIMNACAVGFYQMPVAKELLRTFAETTTREVTEFIGELEHNLLSLITSPYLYVAGALISLLVLLFRRTGRKVFLRVVMLSSLTGAAMLAHRSLYHSESLCAHCIFYRTAKGVIDVCNAEAEFDRLTQSLPPLPDPESVTSKHLASTVVVVIGESAASTHLSAYGYGLPTSQRFDEMRDSLFVFTEAVSASTSTSENMDRILTLKRDNQISEDPFSFPRLISIFNQADYKTFWLSNQERKGIYSNNSNIFSLEASVTDYIKDHPVDNAPSSGFDEQLLPLVRKSITDTNGQKLVFVHLMGSHMEYKLRYPVQHSRFTAADELRVHTPRRPWLKKDGAQVMAHYDNSIHYTDSILGEVIHYVSAQASPSLFIYFSDHGENVYEEGNRNGRGIEYVRIPFVIYMNQAYRTANPEITRMIADARHRPFSTANFAHSLMTLTGTSYKHYDGLNDVLSPSFRPRVRYVNGVPWPADLRKNH